MNTPKYTPAPWWIPHFADNASKCECTSVLSDTQRGMGSIATVHYDEGDQPHYEHREVAEANARIIATAPELYEALAYARRFLKKADHDTDYVDRVLAKARGET